MDRRQSYGDGSPADELLQRLEDLKRSVQQFTSTTLSEPVNLR